MTQRFQKGSNTVNTGAVCEKYMNRFLNREKQTAAALTSLTTKNKDKPVRNVLQTGQNQLLKTRTNVKQQNIPSPNKQRTTSGNSVQYSDDSALMEAAVKAMNPRQRSRSTTVDREPWGQLLKQQKNGDKTSVFGNFDPLRTLHFLAKELQFQLQSVLPEDNTVQQMVTDMQYALKRVPPEVASTVHLQQAIDLLPRMSNSKCNLHKPEKLPVHMVNCSVQTLPIQTFDDNDKLQQIMEQGTLKLENSCKHMEKLCTELKNEKNKLEKELIDAKQCNKMLKKKVSDLELENTEILGPRVKVLEDEKRKLESQLRNIAAKLETVSQHSFNDLKSQITELKSQKNSLEQECNNMKHQMKVGALEREKFVAVLALRDAQINEIRSEMSQLQEVVNEQLMELHNNAFVNIQSMGNIKEVGSTYGKIEQQERKDKSGDGSISTVKEDGYFTPKQNISFKDLQSGDIDISNIGLDEIDKHQMYINPNLDASIQLEKLNSQTSIRMMFNEFKKTAYSVAGDVTGNQCK